MGSSATYDLSVIFKVLDQATGPLAAIGKKFKELTTPINTANESMQKLGKSMMDVGDKMKSIGNTLSLKLTLPLTLLGGLATKSSIDFESAWAGVKKTVEATEPELKKLKEDLMGLAREIPLSTQEIFGIGEAAGQLGIKTKSISSFAKVMADLAAATNLTSDEASTQLARFANITGMSQDKFDRLGSSIVYLGNKLATTEAEIVAMGMRLAGAGKLIGLTEAQTMGLAAALSSVGIESEAGGTAFSQLMMRISKEIGSGSKEIQGFAKVSGKSVKDFEKDWKNKPVDTLIGFIEGLDKIGKKGVNVGRVLDYLGLDGARLADSLLRASGSGDLFRSAIEKSSFAWEENIALVNEANERYKTTASQLTIAKNKFIQMAAAFGDIIAPAILFVVKVLSPMINYLKSLSPEMKTVIILLGAFAASLGPLLIVAGSLIWAFGMITSVMTPALIATIAPIASTIGLVILILAAWSVALYRLYKDWNLIKTSFKEDFWGSIVDAIKAVFDTLTWGIRKSFGFMMSYAEKIISVYKSIGKYIGDILSKIPNFIKKKMGIEIETNTPKTNYSTGFGAFPEISFGEIAKSFGSQTDININVTSDSGITATVDSIKKVKGDSNVKAATLGYVGAW